MSMPPDRLIPPPLSLSPSLMKIAQRQSLRSIIMRNSKVRIHISDIPRQSESNVRGSIPWAPEVSRSRRAGAEITGGIASAQSPAARDLRTVWNAKYHLRDPISRTYNLRDPISGPWRLGTRYNVRTQKYNARTLETGDEVQCQDPEVQYQDPGDWGRGTMSGPKSTMSGPWGLGMRYNVRTQQTGDVRTGKIKEKKW